jgi:hypothetical protein
MSIHVPLPQHNTPYRADANITDGDDDLIVVVTDRPSLGPVWTSGGQGEDYFER